jgi:hypothetical protein
MLRHRPTSAALACVLALVPAVAAGCGKGGHEEEGEPRREGLFTSLAGLKYNVYLTRQLNLRDTEDADYLVNVEEAPPGESYYGVFVVVCNDSDDTLPAARSFRIKDTQGNEFEPIDLPEENVFAYQPADIEPHRCIPQRGSAAASGPTQGALIVFRLPATAAENRPLELEVSPPSGTGELAVFELDI